MERIAQSLVKAILKEARTAKGIWGKQVGTLSLSNSFKHSSLLKCENTLCIVGVERKLFATCDNEMKVYFDGIEQEQDDAMADWTKTSQLTIPAGTQVLAIECKDLGSQEGILASTNDGLVTNLDWRCSDSLDEGWALPGIFAPLETFALPQSYGKNGVHPWFERFKNISFMLS